MVEAWKCLFAMTLVSFPIFESINTWTDCDLYMPDVQWNAIISNSPT